MEGLGKFLAGCMFGAFLGVAAVGVVNFVKALVQHLRHKPYRPGIDLNVNTRECIPIRTSPCEGTYPGNILDELRAEARREAEELEEERIRMEGVDVPVRADSYITPAGKWEGAR